MSRQAANLDFDEEARNLWARLNLDPQYKGSGKVWNPVDPIYRHPTGGGTIYVGNQSAAEDLNAMRSLGVTHVVNCTHGFGKIPNFHESKLKYYTFDVRTLLNLLTSTELSVQVSHWSSHVNSTHTSVIAFVSPMFQFIENAIAAGNSVLVHCLAGAHRAGTTGCACLVYFANMNVSTAIATAKRCRSIIDPIGQLPAFLMRLQDALLDQGRSLGAGRGTITSSASASSSAASHTL